MKKHTQKRTFLGMFFARGMFFFASKHGLGQGKTKVGRGTVGFT